MRRCVAGLRRNRRLFAGHRMQAFFRKTVRNRMKKRTPPKPSKKIPAGEKQKFNAVEAKRDAMAMFDVSLNHFRRGADNKWRRTVKP
jgi:hypothetical protein